MYFPTLILAKSTQLSIIMKHRHRQKLIYYLTNCNPKLTRSLFHFPYRLASTPRCDFLQKHKFGKDIHEPRILRAGCAMLPFFGKKDREELYPLHVAVFWSNGKCGPSTFGVQTARVISSTVESCVFVFRSDTHLQVLFFSSSSRHLSGS